TLNPLTRRAVLLAAAALATLAPLAAQTAPAASGTSGASSAATPPVQPTPDLNVQEMAGALYEHDFSAGIKNTGNGDLSTDRFGLFYKSKADYQQVNHIETTVGYSFTHYDFTGIPAPFSSVNNIGASVYYLRDLQEQWGAFGYIGADIAADNDTNFFDGA